MDSRKKIILQPEYVKYFVCDGSSCEDNCCQGMWVIYVDEKHYKKIKKVHNNELKERIDKYIRRNRSNATSQNYGIIHQDKEIKQCVFLTEDRLCDMQMKLGADYLCNTCMVYPRHISIIDGKYERSLTMSCPIAAKDTLFNPQPMAFEQFEDIHELRTGVHNPILHTEGQGLENKLQKYFWDIRIFSIGLLQNRNYSLEDRLIILGIVYKKIEELNENKRLSEIPSMLASMIETVEADFFKEELEKINPNYQIQFQMTKAMVDRRAVQGLTSERYLECLTETLLGIGHIEGEEIENIIKKYEESYKKYYMPYMKEKEYILENYLVNEYFKELMPFGYYKTIWEAYTFLCTLYSMVKLHLIGIAGFNKGLNDDLTLKLIQSLSKEATHNRYYIQGVVGAIKDSGYDSLAYMSILLKN